MQKQELEKYAHKLGILKSDFELILEKNLNISKTKLFLTNFIPEKYVGDIKKDLKKRKKGEPIEYITKKSEFFSLDFFVDKRVLVPRNDTEIMIKKVLEIKNLRDFYLIDVGTGSAIIPISIIKNSNIPKIFATDISEKSLEVAEINTKKHKLKSKIKLLESNLLDKFMQKNKYNFKNIIITANLPYIKNGDYENMDFETIKFEPKIALFGGEKTGFEMYEKLIKQVFKLKKLYKIKKIILFIEIGFDQKNIAENFLKEKNLKFELFKDNSGIWRCIKIFFDF